MSLESIAAQVVSIPAIFSKARKEEYFNKQIEKMALCEKINSILKSLPKKVDTYDEAVILEETLLNASAAISTLLLEFDSLEDDYPTPGKETPYSDGVAI